MQKIIYKDRELTLPRSITVDDHGDVIVICRRWRHVRQLTNLIFGMGLLVLLIATSENYNPLSVFELESPLAIAFWGTNYVFIFFLLTINLAMWINKSALTISKENVVLKVSPFPLPWAHSRRLEMSEISAFSVKDTLAKANFWGSKSDYHIHANLKSGKNIKLFKGLESVWQAQWLENRFNSYLKSYLDIQKLRVQGEY